MSQPQREEIDHRYTDEIVCPHCGYVHADSYEYFSDHHRDETECECGECEKEFKAYRNFSVSYSTYA